MTRFYSDRQFSVARSRRLEGKAGNGAEALLFYGLSTSLLFALAAVSGHLGLQYTIGYSIRTLDFVIFSKQIDPFVWLGGSAATIVGAMMLATSQPSHREKLIYFLYSLVTLTQICLFLIRRTDAAYILSLAFDTALITLTAAFARKFGTETQPKGAFMTLVGLLALLISIEVVGLLVRMLNAFLPNLLGNSTLFLRGTELQSELSGLFFIYSPTLMLAAIFIWIPMLLLTLLIPRYKRTRSRDPIGLRRVPDLSRAVSLALLGLAVVLAVFVCLSPYVAVQRPRGVDAGYYYGVVSSIPNLSVAISQLGISYTAVYVLFLYLIRTLTGWDYSLVVIVGPGFLAAFGTLASYLVTKEMTESRLASVVAGLLAATWVHTTVGLFAGIFPNWLSISMMFVFIYLMYKTTTRPGVMSIAVTCLFGFLVALAYPWTWGVMIAATVIGFLLAILGLMIYRRDVSLGREVKAYSLVLLFTAVLFLVFPGLRFAPIYGALNIMNSVNLTRLDLILPTLSVTLTRYVGALFAYPSMSLLTILGGLYMAKLNPRAARILASYMMISVSTIMFDSYYQWRVLYEIPFEILAATGVLGMIAAINWASRRVGIESDHSRLVLALELLLIALIILDSVNYALVSDIILPIGA